MRIARTLLVPLLAVVTLLAPAVVARAQGLSASAVLAQTLSKAIAILDPATPEGSRTFTADLRLTKAEGLPKELRDATLSVAFQAPDKLLLRAKWKGEEALLGREGNSLWVYVPSKKFGVVGSPDTPRFLNDPTSVDGFPLPAFRSPIGRAELLALPLLIQATPGAAEAVGGAPCQVMTLRVQPRLAEMLGVAAPPVEVAIRDADRFPARVRFADGAISAELEVVSPQLVEAWPADKWKLPAKEGDTIEKVANSHLLRCLDVVSKQLGAEVPTLGPATGSRRLVATSGKGWLEDRDGTRVLFLNGTPEEMGRQHGELLRNEIRSVTERILFGVGVGSSFAKGKWFFREIEEAHARLAPFISERTYRELDALAVAAGMDKREMRLANFFPELFHCTGFALHGGATKDGRIYHGRVLDYLRGVGLEANAVVMVVRPDVGHAWVNLGYAGFTGTISAMNEKQISLGEMGGRGEGNWDGKPMAQLMREVMENASTLEEAVEIFRKGPRTCEYYYVVADGKTGRSVAIKGTPTVFETVGPGEPHPQLAHPVKDAVLLSAGDRYEELVRRVKSGWGTFDADSARALMDPPVCMSSNIQSVLFAPDTLDFWVANADSKNVASNTRYTRYNLRELLAARPEDLKPSSAAAAAAAARDAGR